METLPEIKTLKVITAIKEGFTIDKALFREGCIWQEFSEYDQKLLEMAYMFEAKRRLSESV